MAAFAPPCLTALLPSFSGLEAVPKWRHLLALSALVALVCAPFSWIIARRRNVSTGGCLTWSLGTLALGLPGLLSLLSIEDKPPRKTPVERSPDIEIFEPVIKA
jgi:hypothetical protein